MGGEADGPGLSSAQDDLSDMAPGGRHFEASEQKNLTPRAGKTLAADRVPGPGEPGFKAARQQSDLTPEQKPLRKGTARKKAQ